MDENRILESSELRLKELESMIKRDRNHPCVFCWSLSNEEVSGSSIMAQRMAARMAAVVRKLDSKRFLISAELLDFEGSISPAYLDVFDVIGVNYPESPLMGKGLDNIKKKFPNKPIMSTESASYFSTRGVYEDNFERCHTSNYGSCFSMISSEPLPQDAPGAGGTAHPEMVMDFYKTHPFMGGSFLWTAFDYYGEPSPFIWPAISPSWSSGYLWL
jgi:beta-galactosidase